MGICTGFNVTFNFCKKGWVLGNFGIISTRYQVKDRKYGATYNLFGVCLMKSETIHGFYQFCTIYGHSLNCFLMSHLSFGPSWSIILIKFQQVYCRIVRTPGCWVVGPIWSKNAVKNKFVDQSKHYNAILKNLDVLHELSSRKAFKLMLEVMIEHCVMKLGEEKYAPWFESTYLLWKRRIAGLWPHHRKVCKGSLNNQQWKATCVAGVLLKSHNSRNSGKLQKVR